MLHNQLYDNIAIHPDASAPQWNWYKTTSKTQWSNFSDIKQTFNSVDYVGEQHYVFNIKHNEYRLIVVIKFSVGIVYIRFIGTHAEYDKIDDITKI